MTVPFFNEDDELTNERGQSQIIEINEKSNVDYGQEVDDDYEYYLFDITTAHDDNSIYYNSPLSNYFNPNKQEQLIEEMTNLEVISESSLVMKQIADRMNQNYFPIVQTNHAKNSNSHLFGINENVNLTPFSILTKVIRFMLELSRNSY